MSSESYVDRKNYNVYLFKQLHYDEQDLYLSPSGKIMKTKQAVPVFKTVTQLKIISPASVEPDGSDKENCDSGIFEAITSTHKVNNKPKKRSHQMGLLHTEAALEYVHMEFLDEAFHHPEGLGGVALGKQMVTVPNCENCSEKSR